ncbi:RHS repeat domain-containing protein [Nostoc linckia]|uniref:RHS repeat domain-containing protein n=1 Tax=Nostoc linckia TaxID=92942 RepID=UPI0015D4E01F|nr:RHS repeat domain-containing protein [Nostoc linckia]
MSIIDALGGETKFCYDGRDRLIETIRPDGTSEKLRYDLDNRTLAKVFCGKIIDLAICD